MNKGYFKGLSIGTVLLAVSSLFSDIGTEMLYPILPVFLTSVLGSSVAIVGVIEGVATATQFIIQGFSGWISDRFQKRKQVALFGFALAAVAKPLVGFAPSWEFVLGARFFDRLGSGTRSAPRDALVAASVDERYRGKAFGLEGLGDNLGAFLGPIVALLLLYFLHVPMRSMFLLVFIPATLALVLIFFVKEKHISPKEKTNLSFSLKQFPASYWKYIATIALFDLGNSSNSFLILRTKDIGIPFEITILIYAFFNLVAALISYPSGALSDRLGRKKVLLGSFLIFLVTYIGFALSHNFLVVGFLFIFYGLYQGIFRAVGKAYATDFVPAHLRASGVGIYSSTIGVFGLIASVVGGYLWTTVNPEATFLYGASFAFVGIIALVLFVSKPVRSSS